MVKEELYIADEDKDEPKSEKSKKRSNRLFIICIIIILIALGISYIAFEQEVNTTVTLSKSNFELPNGTQIETENQTNQSIVTLKTYDGDGEITIMEGKKVNYTDFEDYTIEDYYVKNISGVEVSIYELTNNNYNDKSEVDYIFNKNGIKYMIISTSSPYYVQDIIKTLKLNDR
ncbi:hypothetical protein [Methanobrevibacter wolinii]|uniref:hypothetical protein n=1 Tax=Methanobrevibacter wolinii TaxID=190977 RepID=UPI0005B2DE2B|nr:hypothetical protein [Methanobrevibacter wolinii]